ncbi:MAG: hypothetical protein V4603_19240, partial [Pseudomonadota bacterium]
GKVYYLEISYSKANSSVGAVKLGDDASFAVVAQATGPQTGISIDLVNRRISFTNVSLAGGGLSLVLNGTLEYPPNNVAANRAACG